LKVKKQPPKDDESEDQQDTTPSKGV
jgi:hypothetical protein